MSAKFRLGVRVILMSEHATGEGKFPRPPPAGVTVGMMGAVVGVPLNFPGYFRVTWDAYPDRAARVHHSQLDRLDPVQRRPHGRSPGRPERAPAVGRSR